LRMIFVSTRALSFAMMRPGIFGVDFFISRSMRRSSVSWVVTGEIMNLRNMDATVSEVSMSPAVHELKPVRMLKRAETSLPKSGLQVKRPMSV